MRFSPFDDLLGPAGTDAGNRRKILCGGPIDGNFLTQDQRCRTACRSRSGNCGLALLLPVLPALVDMGPTGDQDRKDHEKDADFPKMVLQKQRSSTLEKKLGIHIKNKGPTVSFF